MIVNGTDGGAVAMSQDMNTAGFGYGIAIAVAILVLLSTIMLASYVCVRIHGRNRAVRVRGVMGDVRVPETRTVAADNNTVDDGVNAGGNRRVMGAVDIVTGHGDNWVIGGLDEATLESYPKFSYAGKKVFHGYQHGDDASCSICLADYLNGEVIRVLPDCCHSFHAACVDAWLRLHASCPMCRTSPLPTPISTPLSELIPLARHSLQSQ